MREFFENLMPHVIPKLPDLWKATLETLAMTGLSALYILVIGMALGILLTITKKGGLAENAAVYRILDVIINLLRSVPFIILLFLLIPLTRIISGTSIGVAGSIFPLIVGTVPFFSRQAEAALAGVNPGLIEAAQSMGCSKAGIIFRVYLRESIPALSRGITITLINGWCCRRRRTGQLCLRPGRAEKQLRHHRCRSHRTGGYRTDNPDCRQHHRKENRKIIRSMAATPTGNHN